MKDKIFGKQDEVYISNEVELMAQDFRPSVIIVDVIGVGGGVASILRKKAEMWNWTCKIIEFNGTERQKSGVPEYFYNRRAEATWLVGEMFGDHQVELTYKSVDLERDLTAYKYNFKGDQLIIQPKEIMKKDLGRSPDHGDAYIMGIYALQFATEEQTLVHTFRHKRSHRTFMSS